MNNIKRNILFVSHVASKEYGGAERVLDNIVCGIDVNRFNPVLLLQKTSRNITDLGWDCGSFANIEYLDFGELSHGNKIVALMALFGRIVKAFFRVSYLIRKHDIDIVCANSIIAGVFTAIPARLFAKRFFYYEHNIADQRKGHLIGLALKPVSLLATDIICISRSVKESLISEKIPESKLHLVYNGYNFSRLGKDSGNRASLPPRHQEGSLRIGMVANYIPWKRHNYFLDLADKLSASLPGIKVEATIVGGCLPGHEEYFNDIARWVDDYTGSVKYTLAGFQDNVADYFRSFDILINPAKAEPFGLIFLEAMFAECVVIGSIDGAASEIIEDGISGFVVDFDNPNDVIRKVSSLAMDIPGRKTIGVNASASVQKNFSIERQLREIEKLFAEGKGK